MKSLLFLISTVIVLILMIDESVFAIPIVGIAEIGDYFGSSVATGDFDGDGFDDLAVGVTHEDLQIGTDNIQNTGVINVIYGSQGSGISGTGNQVWHQDSPGILGIAEKNNYFGGSLAAGDFDGDGFDDLAVGVGFEELRNNILQAGVVNVIYGSRLFGLTATGNQVWHQDSPGILGIAETSDYFGSSVAAGDFDGDGFDDLAVGVTGEDLQIGTDNIYNTGVVNVIYGSQGSGLTATGNQVWHQDSPGILDAEEKGAESGDTFGTSVTTGDFNNNGIEDLGIGVPGETIINNNLAGSVNVIYGSQGSGLTALGNEAWDQNSPGILDDAETPDSFGGHVTAGDFDGDGFDDLTIGVQFEKIDSTIPGAVNLIYGAQGSGLSEIGNQLWHQDSPGILGVAENNDYLGTNAATGDFDGDGFDDLAVGVGYEDLQIDQVNREDTGVVNVIYGSQGSGLTATGNQVWHQDSPGILGIAEKFDRFSYSDVAAGDFDGDGFDDLVVGVPEEDLQIDQVNREDTGVVNVIYGSQGSGLSATGNQVWHQDSDG